jgi:hypothetical protein
VKARAQKISGRPLLPNNGPITAVRSSSLFRTPGGNIKRRANGVLPVLRLHAFQPCASPAMLCK